MHAVPRESPASETRMVNTYCFDNPIIDVKIIDRRIVEGSRKLRRCSYMIDRHFMGLDGTSWFVIRINL